MAQDAASTQATSTAARRRLWHEEKSAREPSATDGYGTSTRSNAFSVAPESLGDPLALRATPQGCGLATSADEEAPEGSDIPAQEAYFATARYDDRFQPHKLHNYQNPRIRNEDRYGSKLLVCELESD